MGILNSPGLFRFSFAGGTNRSSRPVKPRLLIPPETRVLDLLRLVHVLLFAR